MISDKREKLARFGIGTKGFVYCLIGLLTTLAAFNVSSDAAGSKGVLDFLSNQPFGKVLLGITAAGLMAFVFWRLYQTFFDPDHKGDDAKGLTTRISFLSGALVYGFLAFSALKLVIGAGSGGSGGKESMIQSLLDKTYGQILVAVIAAGFLGKAFIQFKFAYSEKFRNDVKTSDLDSRAQKAIIRSGKIGYTARGIVILIISFLLF
ncbi:MAG: DUF1206 domain-containing protein, partial [Leeuwenhoekiella sp.]